MYPFLRPILILHLLLLFLAVEATVRLSPALSHGMVLQRDSHVKLEGRADPGERVCAGASWLKEKVCTITGPDGKWSVTIYTGPAGGPHTLVISGSNQLVISDILFGEVWLCSGQSNMEFTIRMLGGWRKYKNERREMVDGDYSRVRLCRVEPAWSDTLQDSCRASWQQASVAAVEDFSATAWFFGKMLFDSLQVPVGLISASLGGTPAEAWTEQSALENVASLQYFLQSPNGRQHASCRHSVLYNAMVNPLLHYRIRGVTWYQGESNRLQADLYAELFTTLIASWRKAWGLGDFPFLFVQIAPYDYGESFNAAAYLREAQTRALLLPNTGMVATADIGDIRDIHPHNKPEVGRRLALQALSRVYGFSRLTSEGPFPDRIVAEGNTLRLWFRNAQGGLLVKQECLESFTVAGPDHIFRPAAILIQDNCLLLTSPDVPDPRYVRYAFTDTACGSLLNTAGLPAAPFRTDTLPFFIRPVEFLYFTDDLSGSTFASLICKDTTLSVRYTTDGSEPDENSPLFTAPIAVTSSCTIAARPFRGRYGSVMTSISSFTRHSALNRPVTLLHPNDPKYTGGDNSLVDGLRGSAEFGDGHWKGFRGDDFEATIDLGDTYNLRSVSTRFLHDSRSWIFLPVTVTFSISNDGVIFRDLVKLKTDDSQRRGDAFVKEYCWRMGGQADGRTGGQEDGRTGGQEGGRTDGQADGRTGGREDVEAGVVMARYVRVTAKSLGKCPRWHPGRGEKSWLFVDEVVVN